MHASVCGFVHIGACAERSQKRALDPLGLALQVIMSSPTQKLENQFRSSARAACALNV